MLRRAPEPRRHVGNRERTERVGRGLRGEAAAHEEASGHEQVASRHDPRQGGVAELDDPGRKAADRREERDGLDGDAELVDYLEIDERQQHRLGMVDCMGDRKEPQRAHRVHVDGRAHARRGLCRGDH